MGTPLTEWIYNGHERATFMGAWAEARLHRFKNSAGWHWFWRSIAGPAGFCLSRYSKAKLGTVRVSVEGPGADYAGAAVYANWHRHLPFLIMHHGQHRRWIMISPAPYLDPIEQWCARLGVRVVRGTTGERGREALAELLAHLREGESAFLAVDGPAGPAFQAKRGCVDLARAAGVPLIPVAYACKRGRTNYRRWDQWLPFKFFDRITVRYGEPIVVGTDEPEAEAVRRVEAGLRQVATDVAPFRG